MASFGMALQNGKTPREQLLTRWSALKNERASWMSHWQEISGFLMPRNGRFFVTDRNRGARRHNLIFDNTATRALRVMAAGMMAGATSPARPWFKLKAGDPGLSKFRPVRGWFEEVALRIHSVFQKSNTYPCLQQHYLELGGFGTSNSIMVESAETIVHHHSLTVGEYAITDDFSSKVCTSYREFQRSVGSLVKEFGIANVSENVRQMFNNGELDGWVTVVHAIEPREDRDAQAEDSKNMRWRSVYFEPNAPAQATALRESGYRRYPCLTPRWTVIGGDVYGHGPGMECLGDVKQLQHEQRRKAEGIDFKVRPPLQAPTSMKDRDTNMLPGGITYIDSANPNGAIRTSFETQIDLEHLLEDLRDVRERINASFYVDLFLMLANSVQDQKTATEVAELKEEKLLMLGPVWENVQTELLQPLVTYTFERMFALGLLPPIPEELAGSDISIEFVSVLAQAQRAIGVNSIDRFVGNLGAISQNWPEARDKFNYDAWVDDYTDRLGVPIALINSDEDIAKLRQARNAANAAKEKVAAQEVQSKTAANLAKAGVGAGAGGAAGGAAGVGGGPGLGGGPQDLINNVAGYSSPSPVEVGGGQ